LRESVKHAERLIGELERLDAEIRGSRFQNPDEPTDAERWLEGRVSEIEVIVGDVVREWGDETISATSAASLLDRYLDALHQGLIDAFSMRHPPCCAPLATTSDESVRTTRNAPMLGVMAVSLRDTPTLPSGGRE
jgi:hypothetical protein